MLLWSFLITLFRKKEDIRKNIEYYYRPVPIINGIYDIDSIKNINGLDIWLIPINYKKVYPSNHKILVHFNSFQSYTCIDESYCESFWIDSSEKAWTFYKSNTSYYIEMLRNTSILFRECRKNAVHYAIVGTNSTLHIISDEEPDISII